MTSRRLLIAEHMLRDGHARDPLFHNNDLKKRSRSPFQDSRHYGERPHLPCCYICKSQFGHASIEIHQQQCYIVNLLRWEREDPETRGRKPLSPDEHEHLFGPFAHRSGAAAENQYQLAREAPPDDPTTISCPTCARLFHVNHIQRHLVLCAPRSSSSRGRAEARRRGSPHKSLALTARVETSFNARDAEAIFRQSRMLNGRSGGGGGGGIGVRPSSASPNSSPAARRRNQLRNQLEGQDLLEREADEFLHDQPSLTRLGNAGKTRDDSSSVADSESARRHRVIGMNHDPFPAAAAAAAAAASSERSRVINNLNAPQEPMKKPDSVLEAERLFPHQQSSISSSSRRNLSTSPEAKRPADDDQDPSNSAGASFYHSGSSTALPENLTRMQQQIDSRKTSAAAGGASSGGKRMTLMERAEAQFKPCKHCSRRFAPDRIDMHERVCLDQHKHHHAHNTSPNRLRQQQQQQQRYSSASPKNLSSTRNTRRPQSAGMSSSPLSGSPTSKKTTVRKPAILNNPQPATSAKMNVRASSSEARAATAMAAVANLMRCTFCGYRLAGEARFCSNCGQKQE